MLDFGLNAILNVINFLTEARQYWGFISCIAWFDFTRLINGITDFDY